MEPLLARVMEDGPPGSSRRLQYLDSLKSSAKDLSLTKLGIEISRKNL